MASKDSERELGSNKQYQIEEDGSISYFTDNVSDEVRAAAESERDRMTAEKREQAQQRDPNTDREVGTPGVAAEGTPATVTASVEEQDQ